MSLQGAVLLKLKGTKTLSLSLDLADLKCLPSLRTLMSQINGHNTSDMDLTDKTTCKNTQRGEIITFVRFLLLLSCAWIFLNLAGSLNSKLKSTSHANYSPIIEELTEQSFENYDVKFFKDSWCAECIFRIYHVLEYILASRYEKKVHDKKSTHFNYYAETCQWVRKSPNVICNLLKR